MSKLDDLLIGKQALTSGLITLEDLQQCLKKHEISKRQGKESSIEKVLLEGGFVTQEEINSIKRIISQSGPITKKRSAKDYQSTNSQEEKSLGRYQIIEKIASGGMGHVYKGYDPNLQRYLALKILSSENECSVERFLQEARLMANLRHPNIVGIHDIGVEDGQNFFAMDFVKGITLTEYLIKQKPSIAEIIDITLKICNALSYAHSKNVIHRDLKPANIMLDEEELEPKVLDFGLAKISGSRNSLSVHGGMIGTLYYMAPEQIDGDTSLVDNRTDIYGIGATLFELLTGKTPFISKSFATMMQLIREEPAPSPLKYNPNIPSALADICVKALHKKKEDRYQSVEEISQALSNITLHDSPSGEEQDPLSSSSSAIDVNALNGLVNGYSFSKIIGYGSTGTIYQAKQESVDRDVAIKVISENFCKDQTYLHRFMREARISAQLHHPGIVQGVDFREVQGLYYYVMEYVDGESLQKKLEKEGRLETALALNIVLQISQALEYGKKYGFVHRDIKPDNILLDKNGTAKLCDLGLAKTNEDKGESAELFMGSSFYISPEQALGHHDIDVRSDIYSLGVTLFHLLTGNTPYAKSNNIDLISQHIRAPLPSKEDFPPEVSDDIHHVVCRMMEKSRIDRYQSAEDLSFDLKDILASKSPRSRKTKTIKKEKPAINTATISTNSRKVNSITADPTEEIASFTPPEIRRVDRSHKLVKQLEQNELTTGAKRKRRSRIFYLIIFLLLFSNVGYFFIVDENIAKIHPKLGKYREKARQVLQLDPQVDISLLDDNITSYSPDKIKSTQSHFSKTLQNITRRKLKKQDAEKTMVFVEAGEVKQGDKVTMMTAFYLDINEVSNKNYYEFCRATNHPFPDYWGKELAKTLEDFPVVNVSLYDAKLFAQWSGKRLPSAVEWEYGARKVARGEYIWGNQYRPNMANIERLGLVHSSSFARGQSPNGISHLHGNAWEWTATPLEGLDYVIKGGSFRSTPEMAKISYQDGFRSTSRRLDIGFRCVVSVNELE